MSALLTIVQRGKVRNLICHDLSQFQHFTATSSLFLSSYWSCVCPCHYSWCALAQLRCGVTQFWTDHSCLISLKKYRCKASLRRREALLHIKSLMQMQSAETLVCLTWPPQCHYKNTQRKMCYCVVMPEGSASLLRHVWLVCFQV